MQIENVPNMGVSVEDQITAIRDQINIQRMNGGEDAAKTIKSLEDRLVELGAPVEEPEMAGME